MKYSYVQQVYTRSFRYFFEITDILRHICQFYAQVWDSGWDYGSTSNKYNRITSSGLLSNDRRVVSFVISHLGLRDANMGVRGSKSEKSNMF